MQNTCNPFTVTADQVPEDTYIITENINEIVENFSYDRPAESIYKIVGVGGTGKTVVLRMVVEKLKGMSNGESGWLFFDINASGDILKQIAERFAEEGFRYLPKKDGMFWDIGVEVEGMIQQVQQKKILIAIDDVSKSPQMIKVISEYGRWLRAGYPVYFICTGSYENMHELSSVKNLTFFRRAVTLNTEPLNVVRMSELYRRKLHIDSAQAREMAKVTKGHVYAFQRLGALYFDKKETETLYGDIIPELKAELFSRYYENIWKEMAELDRFLAKLLVDKEEYKREEVLRMMGDKAKNYSMYRDRLIKKGILNSRQGYISLALPFFAEYMKEYC